MHPYGDSISFSWEQVSGPPVVLSDPSAVGPRFEAPVVGREGATLTFCLTVADGVTSSTAEISVRVEYVNHAPVVVAGPEQTVDEASHVALNGTACTDPDGDVLNYSWSQTRGPQVELSSYDGTEPSFEAPVVTAGGAVLEFELTVSDGLLEAADRVVVCVPRGVRDSCVRDNASFASEE